MPKAVSRDFRNGRIRAFLQRRKGQKRQVIAMKELIEFVRFRNQLSLGGVGLVNAMCDKSWVFHATFIPWA